jgi:hypothetical protein
MDKFMEKLVDLIKERWPLLLMFLGILAFILGSWGVIPFGNQPWQEIDSPGRIALGIIGLLLIASGAFLIIREPSPSIGRMSRVHAKHRDTTREQFDNAFKSGQEVVLLSIMSQHTIREIETLLQKAKNSRTRVKVLTLDPNVGHSTIEAIQLHLNEPPHETAVTAQQIKDAWEQWSALTKKYRDELTVRKYRSIPTLQGLLVRDRYVVVELIPYDTRTRDRPGILITRDLDLELFNLFQEKFFSLWESAKE